MNNDRWNEVYFLLSSNIAKDASESAFEQQVIQALRVLGWKQFSGDFEIRPSFQIGAANRITPDFVVKNSDNQKLFVIEIKQPGIPISQSFQQQLFSYMRQLKLEYGVLIGNCIQVFYDGGLNEQDDPLLLETIQFSNDNPKGIRFTELFCKDSFSKDALTAFTLEILRKMNRREAFKKLKETVLSKEFNQKITELIKQEFISEYDGETIDKVLSEVDIIIQDKALYLPVMNTKNNFEDSTGSEKSRNFDYTKYLYKGINYGKNRLVLAVITDYVRQHPELTYNQLKTVFPDSLQGTETFTTEKIANSKKDKRNFTKEDELINVVDEVVSVSTQWGKFNIGRFLDKCKSLGIEVSEC